MNVPSHQISRILAQERIFRSSAFRIALVILLSVTIDSAAQSPLIAYWALTAGGTSQDAGWRGDTDADGNTFISGFVSSANASFGLIHPSGSGDFFLARYTPDGTAMWALRLEARIRDLAVDAQGNAYIVGGFFMADGPVMLGTVTLQSRGNQDGFLAKVAPDGTVLWVDHIGGTGGDRLQGVAVDGAGDIYVAGVSNGTIEVGGNTLTLSSDFDLFLAKYAQNGAAIWAAKVGGPLNVENLVVGADAEGHAYIAGGFPSGGVTFGNTTLTSKGGYDAYLLKYSDSGSLLWATSKGGVLDDFAEAIGVNPSGEVYVTQYAFGRGFILSKYGSSGTLEWEKLGASTSQAFGWGLAIDRTGNVLVTGKFEKNLNFGTNFSAAGDADLYLAAFTSGGDLLWIESGGSGGATVEGSGLGVDREGNVYLSGSVRGRVPFMGVSLEGEPNGDIFVARLSSPPGNVAVGEETLPGRFVLAQNYPNPFNPETMIRFTLPEAQHAELVVYNILGLEVARLFTGRLPAGHHEVRWNAAQEPNGIYLYRLQAGSFKEVRQMALAK